MSILKHFFIRDITKPRYCLTQPAPAPAALDKSQVDALEVTHKLEALQIQNGHAHHDNDKVSVASDMVVPTLFGTLS